MKDGEIIGEANHETLLAQNGHYADLSYTHFRHQSQEYINEAKWRVTLEPSKLATDWA